MILKSIQLVLSELQMFNVFVVSCDFLSLYMRYPVWIHSCKGPDCDFCISQGSV